MLCKIIPSSPSYSTPQRSRLCKRVDISASLSKRPAQPSKGGLRASARSRTQEDTPRSVVPEGAVPGTESGWTPCALGHSCRAEVSEPRRQHLCVLCSLPPSPSCPPLSPGRGRPGRSEQLQLHGAGRVRQWGPQTRRFREKRVETALPSSWDMVVYAQKCVSGCGLILHRAPGVPGDL